MPEVYQVNIAPFINVEFEITTPFGYYPATGSTHRGMDIATGDYDNVYSVVNGTVIETDITATSGGYGNMIVIEDDNNIGHLFAHFKEPTTLKKGDRVSIGDLVGIEGTTGQSSGIHLHWEIQKVVNHKWQYSQPISRYMSAAEFMNIPNQQGLLAIYNPYSPVFPTFKKKKGFNFILYGYYAKLKRKGF